MANEKVALNIEPGKVFVNTTGMYRGHYMYLEGDMIFSRDGTITVTNAGVVILIRPVMVNRRAGAALTMESGPEAKIPKIRGQQVFTEKFEMLLPGSRGILIKPKQDHSIDFFVGKKGGVAYQLPVYIWEKVKIEYNAQKVSSTSQLRFA